MKKMWMGLMMLIAVLNLGMGGQSEEKKITFESPIDAYKIMDLKLPAVKGMTWDIVETGEKDGFINRLHLGSSHGGEYDDRGSSYRDLGYRGMITLEFDLNDENDKQLKAVPTIITISRNSISYIPSNGAWETSIVPKTSWSGLTKLTTVDLEVTLTRKP